MRKFLLTLAVLCGTVSAWAGVTPTEQLKASTILPSMGIPENQYYVLQTKDGGAYWNSATVNTDKNGAESLLSMLCQDLKIVIISIA